MTEAVSTAVDPYLGRTVASALKLEELIGVGTTGRVYRASHVALGHFCAVKVLHRFLVQSPDTKERFHREARLLGAFRHPGIVRVIGSGELPHEPPETHGETYLVYEYLKGKTLREVISGREALQATEALNIVAEIAEGLAAAHQRKIIHRDLKPENVMSVSRGDDEARYVVLDFGLARALDAGGVPLTREGAILGTPQYMSPEATRGEATSTESDVYGLAVILYELLSGSPPFFGGSPLFVMTQHATAEPPRFPEALGIDPAIEGFLFKNLSKNPGARCPNAESFGLELRALTRECQLGRPSPVDKNDAS